MTPHVTETFDVLLKWQNQEETSTLRFSPCSISEFEIFAEIEMRYGLNYQGPARIQFQTCCYAFELQHFDIFSSKEGLETRAIAELRYRPYRCFHDGGKRHTVGETELCIHLGFFDDPLRAGKALEEVIQALKMDCNISPEHGPLGSAQ